MVQEALRLVGVDAVITIMDDTELSNITPIKLFRVHLHAVQKQVTIFDMNVFLQDCFI